MVQICRLPARLDWKINVPAVRRPVGKIVAPAIVGQLHPLLAGDVHDVNILCSRRPRSVLAHPGHNQKLSVGRPRGRDCITLIGQPLHVGAVRFHGVNLQADLCAHLPTQLRSGLAIPCRRDIGTLKRCDPLQVRSRGIDDVDFGISAARRRECNLGAVGRPGRRQVSAHPTGER